MDSKVAQTPLDNMSEEELNAEKAANDAAIQELKADGPKTAKAMRKALKDLHRIGVTSGANGYDASAVAEKEMQLIRDMTAPIGGENIDEIAKLMISFGETLLALSDFATTGFHTTLNDGVFKLSQAAEGLRTSSKDGWKWDEEMVHAIKKQMAKHSSTLQGLAASHALIEDAAVKTPSVSRTPKSEETPGANANTRPAPQKPAAKKNAPMQLSIDNEEETPKKPTKKTAGKMPALDDEEEETPKKTKKKAAAKAKATNNEGETPVKKRKAMDINFSDAEDAEEGPPPPLQRKKRSVVKKETTYEHLGDDDSDTEQKYGLGKYLDNKHEKKRFDSAEIGRNTSAEKVEEIRSKSKGKAHKSKPKVVENDSD